MAQTRFARSRVGLRVWFHAIFLFSGDQDGISARELQRMLGLTYKTAWRIRNTIIDVKFGMSEYWSRDKEVDFETLLAALISSNQPSPQRQARRSSAA